MTVKCRAYVALDPIRLPGRFIDFEPGETLADIAERIPLEHPEFRAHLTCRVGAVTFEPAFWHLYRPKPGLVPRFTKVPQGGRGTIGRIFVAAVAVAAIAASFYVGGPGASAWAMAAASALRAAGAIALTYAMQGFRRKPPQSSQSAGEGIGSASGVNDFAPNGPLPRVMGTRRVWPKTVVPPYRLWIDNDEYVVWAGDLAGPHTIIDVRSGDDKLEDAEDALVQVQDGTTANLVMGLLDRGTRIDSSPGIKLSEWLIDENYSDSVFPPLKGTVAEAEPQWHAFETKRDPHKIFIGYEFPIGLDHVGAGSGVFLRHRIRAVGATTWITLPDLLVANRINSPFRVGFEIWFVDTIPAAAGNEWLNSSEQNNKGFFDLNPFVAGSEDYATPTAGIRGYEEWLWAEKKVILFLLRSAFPVARYQFEVKRSWPFVFSSYNPESRAVDYDPPGGPPTVTLDFFVPITIDGAPAVPHNSSAFADDIQLTLVTSIYNEYPIDDALGLPAARIAVQLKNRTLNSINCIATGHTSFVSLDPVSSPVPSSNPAHWFEHALISEHNADPVALAQIRTAELLAWANECTARGWEVHAVLDGTSIDDVLDICAEAGFAVPRRGPTYGVVMDRLRDGPDDGFTGAVSLRNANGFSWQKTLDQIPHALKCTFSDAAQDYGEHEIIVYADGYNADGSGGQIQASRFEARRYDNITKEAQVISRAGHDLRWMQNRSTIINAMMEVEGFEHEMGSRLLVQDGGMLRYGGEGRVKEVVIEAGLVTALEIDEYADLAGANDLYDIPDLYAVLDLYEASAGVHIRLRDGTMLAKQVVLPVVDPLLRSRVTFTTPFAMPTLSGDPQILRGSLVLIGALTTGRDMLLWGVTPGRGNTFGLRLIDTANLAMFDVTQLADDEDEAITDDQDNQLMDEAA